MKIKQTFKINNINLSILCGVEYKRFHYYKKNKKFKVVSPFSL